MLFPEIHPSKFRAADKLLVSKRFQKAEQILGVTAATLGGFSESNPDEMDRIFADAMFKQFHFKFRGRMEVFQVSVLDISKE